MERERDGVFMEDKARKTVYFKRNMISLTLQ